jgi:hypothetical protein
MPDHLTTAELLAYTDERMSKATIKRFVNNAKCAKLTNPTEIQKLADHERSVGKPPRKAK